MASASGPNIEVVFSDRLGEIRPRHGVNNGPADFGGVVDLSEHHRAIGVPSTRLHDPHWPAPDVVDIPAVFPHFELDPDDPASYHFAKTDDYLQAIVDVGSKIVYRLGVSIEHTPRKYHAHPPPDFAKWADVCLHVIRHYNEGWAGGFRHGIRHWEIWNEPDIAAPMWSGTSEQYFDLYETAARAIKSHDAELKVGGPAAAGPTGDFLRAFVARCGDRGVPLDFCSWHTYAADPAALVRNAEAVRKLLDAHGFDNTESHLNEWHYFDGDWRRLRAEPAYAKETFGRINGPTGAAYAAAALIGLQDAPVDVCNYYAGDSLRWGLFDNYGVPHKTFHAFRAFRMLLETPGRVACRGADSGPGIAACAGLAPDGASAGLLVSNLSSADDAVTVTLNSPPWAGATLAEVFAVDGEHDLDAVLRQRIAPGAATVRLDLAAPSVVMVRLSGGQ